VKPDACDGRARTRCPMRVRCPAGRKNSPEFSTGKLSLRQPGRRSRIVTRGAIGSIRFRTAVIIGASPCARARPASSDAQPCGQPDRAGPLSCKREIRSTAHQSSFVDMSNTERATADPSNSAAGPSGLHLPGAQVRGMSNARTLNLRAFLPIYLPRYRTVSCR
jgi:hypothetical protein